MKMWLFFLLFCKRNSSFDRFMEPVSSMTYFMVDFHYRRHNGQKPVFLVSHKNKREYFKLQLSFNSGANIS